MKRTVAVISINNISNIGDELLESTTINLLNLSDKSGDLNYKSVQLLPTRRDLIPRYFLNCIIGKGLFMLSNALPICDLKYRLKNMGFIVKSKKYFMDNLKGVDAVVYAVGMLKYTTQDQSYSIDIINKIANKLKLPVMMSAMSIQKSDLNDWRCRQLIKAINYDNIKMITTRDNEEELAVLQNEYINNSFSIKSACVGDPALWTPETYGVRRVNGENNDLIGIGLIRLGIFEDYGTDIGKEEVFQFYKDLISNLENQHENWALFCNGMQEDYEVGQRLLKELGLSSDRLLSRPEKVSDLLCILSKFSCVFGARLHSCITSYALGIPLVGLVWDNKLRAFSKKIKWEDNFVEPADFDADVVFEKLINVRGEKYDIELFERLKMSTFNAIKEFVNDID